jgi:hypothetical protein
VEGAVNIDVEGLGPERLLELGAGGQMDAGVDLSGKSAGQPASGKCHFTGQEMQARMPGNGGQLGTLFRPAPFGRPDDGVYVKFGEFVKQGLHSKPAHEAGCAGDEEVLHISTTTEEFMGRGLFDD